MKKTLVKRLILPVLLMFCVSASGQYYRKSRRITKSYKADENTELSIKNKYGNIQLITWDKDSVKMEIKIEVKAKKESKADMNLKNVDVAFVDSEYYIEANTTFAGEGSFWTDVKSKTETVFAGENKTQISYKVYLPSHLSLEIENKYGNIYATDYEGPLNILLSNGDLKANALNGKTSIDLQYGYANIKFIKRGKLQLKNHTELDLGEAIELKIESRSSRISIEKIDKLTVNSSKDKYYLKEVNTIDAKTSFSFIEIQQLSGSITLVGRYGDLEIRKLTKEVDKVTFNTESTDITINRTPNQSFYLELIYDEKAELYFSDELKVKSTNKENEEEELVKTKGFLGKAVPDATPINGTMKSGIIRINNN